MEHYRVIIEKKPQHNIEGSKLMKEAKEYLKTETIDEISIATMYDLIGTSENEAKEIIEKLLYDPAMDLEPVSALELIEGEKVFRVEYHNGQFDQRQDSAQTIIREYMGFETVSVKTSRLVRIIGSSEEDFELIKNYYINPIEAREIPIDYFQGQEEEDAKDTVSLVDGFIEADENGLMKIRAEYGFAMDLDDITHCRDYFKTKDRNPTVAELKMLDTYWSDHCRHTTFMTELTEVEISAVKYQQMFQEAYDSYVESREYSHGGKKVMSLMDLATINMREISKKGLLNDKEVSDEINAASIEIDVDIEGRTERWLLMFKNETHNHPTEIEPFGGASTCLGGGIRDPLSGRSFVYQAMRITGAADPRRSYEETRKGKLPQRKITRTAMEGHSSYGYQIGSAAGYVREFYDDGFMAKRLELGALVAAVPKDWVLRGESEPSDLILLVGGETGRDGLGAAVGSSVVQKSDALETAGAEVQKGNPPLERKIVRLFRNPNATKLIKKCNDFGAGGVAVAVGELADGLYIDLDKVPLKYPGLDGGEIALSESQERMAIVIDKENLNEFQRLCNEEDLEAAVIAEVTDNDRVQMVWKGKTIIDIDRDFIETNGIRKKSRVRVIDPEGTPYISRLPEWIKGSKAKEDFLNNISQLNTCSQKGLVERFDNTVGSGSVFIQLGGSYQITPQEGMAAKIPVLNGNTTTCSIMTCGYDPEMANWSTFHGGYYAVIESLAKMTAMGGDFRKARLSFQEFYERLGDDPVKWAKPFTSLLGAFKVQRELDIPSIGGKDSMSGSFEEINVPPSLFSFAVAADNIDNLVSREFKKSGSTVVSVKLKRDENFLIDIEELKRHYTKIKELADSNQVLSASAIKIGGIAGAVAEMAVGNRLGFVFENYSDDLYLPLIGDMILELDESALDIAKQMGWTVVGYTQLEGVIEVAGDKITLLETQYRYTEPLKKVFPFKDEGEPFLQEMIYSRGISKSPRAKIAKPRVLIPVFTGTHGEYDMESAFRNAGAEVETFVLKSFNRNVLRESVKEMAEKIRECQILGLAHGFLLGNEPEAAGRFLSLLFRDEYVSESLNTLLNEKDGLILGTGTGFNSLMNLGLIENGEISERTSESTVISFNRMGEFTSKMANIKVVSNLSPWFSEMKLGDIYTAPVATREGRVMLGRNGQTLIGRGQIATQFFMDDRPTGDGEYNPTGSHLAIESMTSPDGRILGTVSSIDRMGKDIYKNVDIRGFAKIFVSGVRYFD
ncbi:MAG: phosphoribosylformylglycinamidine synthase [Gudongella sp.]|jgi:phosphoribosylformylglycinamidine synthase|nr:phosphoribosylformylglycinamidine synthase [Gudongella sp.]